MQRVPILKIIKNDYLSLLLAIAGPIFLAVSVFVAARGFIPAFRGRGGHDVDHTFAVGALIVSVLLTILFWLLLVRRIARFKRVLRDGVRVPATLTDSYFMKDRGRLEFRYSYEGSEYQTGAAVMKNKQTEAIANGGRFEIAIDPANPGKAIIASLFD